MRTSLTIVVLLVAVSPALAHRLHVEPRLAGDVVRVEAFYDDGTPAEDAKVTLKRGDEIAAEGRTDDKGVWTTPRPKPGTYTVRAESVGHAATADPPLVIPETAASTPVPPEPPAEEREEKTRTPWGRLAAGLGIIAGLWLVWVVARRVRRPTGT